MTRTGHHSTTSEKLEGSYTEEKGQYREKRKVRVKLTQLQIKKFSGKIHELQEFWDSFSSTFHENDKMVGVDKSN